MRDLILRTEAAGNNVTDHGVNKAVEHLPALRDKLSEIHNDYLNIQQYILATFVDRGQLQWLAKPTITATGKRIPGLKLDNPRQLALMHALVRFAQIPPANTFITGEVYPYVIRHPQSHRGAVELGLPSIRPVQAARETPCRKAAPLAPPTVCRPRDILYAGSS